MTSSFFASFSSSSTSCLSLSLSVSLALSVCLSLSVSSCLYLCLSVSVSLILSCCCLLAVPVSVCLSISVSLFLVVACSLFLYLSFFLKHTKLLGWRGSNGSPGIRSSRTEGGGFVLRCRCFQSQYVFMSHPCKNRTSLNTAITVSFYLQCLHSQLLFYTVIIANSYFTQPS